MAAATVAGPDPEATRIIEEFGLQQGATAMAEHPGWHPRRVVVSIPASLSERLPALEQRLMETALRRPAVRGPGDDSQGPR